MALLAVAATAACSKKSSPSQDQEDGPQGVQDQPASKTPVPSKLPWLSDDWPRALAEAAQRNKPIFVDMWAPWCHTCLSMKQHVFTDPALAPYRDRFVWLEMDTDKPEAAPVLEKLEVHTWPTFFIVSPDGKTVHARHLGGGSTTQMRAVLDQGEKSHMAVMAQAGGLDAQSPLGLVAAGDRAAAAGDYAAADIAYGKALDAAPEDWPRTADVLLKQIEAKAKRGDALGCAELGLRKNRAATKSGTASGTDFGYYARDCASALDDPRARLLRGQLIESVSKVVETPEAPLSVDDRSDAFKLLRQLSDDLLDPESAEIYATRQKTLLDRAVNDAPDALVRLTHIWPRMEVYLYLKQADKLVPEMAQAEKDLPDHYEPPYRLASLLVSLGRLDEAEAAALRAEKLVYGPRKANVFKLYAAIAAARNDAEAERQAWQKVIQFLESLPPGHARPDSLQSAKDSLAAVGKAAGKVPPGKDAPR